MIHLLSLMLALAALDDPNQLTIAPPAMTAPNWLTPPNGDDLAHLYPLAAARAHVEGSASIRCLVTIEGYLNSCEVLTETPAGAGFGLATVQASALWRMSPATRDGVPVQGVVTVPIKWKLAPSPAQR
jgi:protein TonB